MVGVRIGVDDVGLDCVDGGSGDVLDVAVVQDEGRHAWG
jgi:hypothetical protein